MNKIKEIILLFLKSTIILSIIWLIFSFIFVFTFNMFADYSLSHKIIISFIIGFGISSTLSLYMIPKHITKINKIEKIYFKNKYNPIQKYEKTYKLINFTDLFNICITSLSKVKIEKIISQDLSIGEIIAITKSSSVSYGEKIIITINQLDNQLHLKIISKPKLMTTILDYGMDLKNINIIKKYLMKEIKE